MHAMRVSILGRSMFGLAALAALAGSTRSAPQAPSTVPGVSSAALDALLDRMRASDADALVLVQDGNTVGEWYFGKPEGPIEAMSATKSVVSLAFGRLLARGKLASLDEPVHHYYPEWKQGRKEAITIRHILGQRSGLQNVPRTIVEIYPSPDFVKLALCAELAEEPGTTFRYNNKACNLLAGLVQRIAGAPLDEFLGTEVFAPLGIADWNWTKDAAGNPHAMSGLQIRPADLAKLGQLMLAEGEWQEQQLLPAEFVREVVRDQAHPASPEMSQMISELWGRSYGLTWWVLDEAEYAVTDRLLASWRESGAPEEFVEKLALVKGVRGPELVKRAIAAAGGDDRWNALTWQANRADFDVVARTPFGFSAEGFLGQYLVVLPAHRLVAVRMRRAPDGEFDERRIDSCVDFAQLVRALVEPPR